MADVPRPPLKWTGGKGQLLNELLHHAPPTFRDYYEPFVGGGALFFALKRLKRLTFGSKQEPIAHLWDNSTELIQTFTTIRDDVESLIEHLEPYQYKKAEFLRIRAWDREPDWPYAYNEVERTARMIYLNRTCYNGLYRVNKAGQFNAPFGKYTNPTICDAENLRAVSKALKGVKLAACDFSVTMEFAESGDFVYLDPPYVPTSDTADFTSYTADGFSMDDHERLANTFELLVHKKVQVMLSNADVPWVRERYKEHRQIRVLASRQINSKKEKRGLVPELIIVPR